jgi:sterol desaturase/sphingolipid hydroxylase (fatty acid hydroxylase superfamily)
LNLIAFLLPKEVLAHRSAILDYKYFFISAIAVTALIGPVLLGAKPTSDFIAGVAADLFNATPMVANPSLVHDVPYTFLLLLALDGGLFFAHYLLHKTPVLWEFHKVHHSAEVLNPITIYRIHPIEVLFTGTISAIFIGTADGLLRAFFTNELSVITILDVNIFLFLFYLAGFNLRHSHVWLSYPAFISRIFISPAQHQVHHSLDPKHYDKNFGYIFAFWDHLMRSLYIPTRYEKLQYGLSGEEHIKFNSVCQLYIRPFSTLWSRYISTRTGSVPRQH